MKQTNILSVLAFLAACGAGIAGEPPPSKNPKAVVLPQPEPKLITDWKG